MKQEVKEAAVPEPPKPQPEAKTVETEMADAAAAASPGASHLLMGHKAFKRKEYGDAIKYLKKSVELDPNLFLAHYWLGRSYVEKGRHSAAVQSFEKAIAIRGEGYRDIDLEYFLAWEYIEDSQYEKAIVLYRERTGRKPEDVEGHFGLAFALKKSGRLDEAAAEYQKAIGCNPNIPSIHFNLANIFEELGRSSDAISEYKAAIALNPEYGEAYFNMGVALQKAGKSEEALEAFNKCIEFGHRERESKKQIKSLLKN